MDNVVPGVQVGKRLTLDGLDARLSAVEDGLAAFANDVYTDFPADAVAVKPFKFVLADEDNSLLELKDARIMELEQLLSDRDAQIRRLTEEVNYYSRECDERQEEIYELQDKLNDAEASFESIRSFL